MTGDPVAGAVVSIGPATAMTGSDGRFELTNLAAGPATLRCVAAGFELFEADITVPSGSMTRDISLTWLELIGFGDFAVYDLTALITSFDPAWGVDMEGAFYTAVVTLSRNSPYSFDGTFADWRYIHPDEEFNLGTALVQGSFANGEVVITAHRLLWYMRGGLMDSGDIVGEWGCCGHISGTFTATRRQTE